MKLGAIFVPILMHPRLGSLVKDTPPASPIWKYVRATMEYYQYERTEFPKYSNDIHRQTWNINTQSFPFGSESIKYVNNSGQPVFMRFQNITLDIWPKLIEFLSFNSPNLQNVQFRFSEEVNLSEEHLAALTNLIPRLDHLRVFVISNVRLLEHQVIQIANACAQSHSLAVVNMISDPPGKHDWADTIKVIDENIQENVTLAAIVLGNPPHLIESSLSSLMNRILSKNSRHSCYRF